MLMANIYGKLGEWEKQSLLFQLMKQRKVKKIPGKTWATYNKVTHEFQAHDKQHPHLTTVLALQKAGTQLLKENGYSPDLSWVSKDMPEQAPTVSALHCIFV